MVVTGQYSVTNCKGNTSLAVNLLNQLYAALLPVIEDAKSSTPSPAYKAFFKDPSYAPLVSTVLTNVTTGVPLSPPALYSFNGGVSFMCVDAPDQFTFRLNRPRDAYEDCLADPNRVSYYIGFDPPKQYVILCPSFFTSGIAPVPPRDLCLTVSTYLDRFHGNGESLRRYQMWVLLNGILQYYLYTTSRSIDVAAPTDVNKCFRLAANRSSENANNYIYYAASIYGQCRDFPSPRDGREILEIDPGDLSDNGSDDPSPVAVEYIATDLNLGVEDTTRTP